MDNTNTYRYPTHIEKSIFRAYDIRGVVGDALTEDLAYAIGLAVGSEAISLNQARIAVGRDGRLSGPALSHALIQGLLESGIEVIDFGAIPTPVLYFAATTRTNATGIMLTGSHNPKNYNGFKTVIAGITLAEERIQQVYQRIISKNFKKGQGKLTHEQVLEDYVQTIAGHIDIKRPIKIAIDCGNGIGGVIARRLFETLGCEVVGLYETVDGHFPNHHPDPSIPENLTDLIQAVKQNQCEVGFAFDGDVDRCGVITDQGNNIWADRQMMLFAIDLLKREPGAEIILDVKSTGLLPKLIKQHGGQPFMYKTGHSLIKNKMRERNAPFAGEMSGHLFFKERWFGFDDGMYTACRLLEILSKQSDTLDTIFKKLPDSVNTPEIKLTIAEEEKFAFMDKLIHSAKFKKGTVNTVDGLRVDFEDGFGLVRPSNTTPFLTLRFEADTPTRLEHIKALFRTELLKVDSTLNLTF